jgi:RNase P subunit RPR2
MSEDDFDELDDFDDEPLDEHETAMIQQDLTDLADFEATFRSEGYRGVAVWCPDCVEEHYYPWDMLRENLQLLLDTGETPVHEPAFAPEPDRYIQWDYARGYVDALRDAGVGDRLSLGRCGRCGLELPETMRQGNFCPRCGSPLLIERLADALRAVGLDDEQVSEALRRAGLPG